MEEDELLGGCVLLEELVVPVADDEGSLEPETEPEAAGGLM
jgi:hypothetical protein